MKRRDVVVGAGMAAGVLGLATRGDSTLARSATYLIQNDGTSLSTSELHYKVGGDQFDLYLARPSAISGPLACVLVFPGWDGLNAPVRDKIHRIASLGYMAVGVDVYGTGVRGDPFGDNSHLMSPLMNDRAMLRDRVVAALSAVRQLPDTDRDRIGAIGYCFGGLCALDLARANPDGLTAVVSFHGVLKPDGLEQSDPIRASILVETGAEDRSAPAGEVQAFCDEMRSRKADWQVHVHGNTMHAFTFEGLSMPEIGLAYNEAADRRSWRAMRLLFEDVLDQPRRIA